jgi:hypothetical protein
MMSWRHVNPHDRPRRRGLHRHRALRTVSRLAAEQRFAAHCTRSKDTRCWRRAGCGSVQDDARAIRGRVRRRRREHAGARNADTHQRSVRAHFESGAPSRPACCRCRRRCVGGRSSHLIRSKRAEFAHVTPPPTCCRCRHGHPRPPARSRVHVWPWPPPAAPAGWRHSAPSRRLWRSRWTSAGPDNQIHIAQDFACFRNFLRA